MYVCIIHTYKKVYMKEITVVFCVLCVCVLRASERQRQSDRNRERGVREGETNTERVCKCGGGGSGGVYWCSSIGGSAFLFTCPDVSKHLLSPLAFFCVPFCPFFFHLAYMYRAPLKFHLASLILLYLCPRITICVLMQLYCIQDSSP